jgi:serine/threonine protein kinase
MDVGSDRVRRLAKGDPQQLGGHVLLGRLGAGGTGTVFLARTAEGQLAAVKIVHRRLVADSAARQRLRSEVERARQVAAPCVARVIGADTEHDPPYLITDYVAGPSLADTVERSGPLRQEDVYALAAAVAGALATLHAAAVIHGDLKPRHVLLGPGSVKVADFGVGLAFEQTSAGSFTAPELFASNPARPTPAADVFEWGAVVAYAATGRPGPEFADLDVFTEPLRGLVQRALEPEPGVRPTAQNLVDALVGGGIPAAANPSVPGSLPTAGLDASSLVAAVSPTAAAHPVAGSNAVADAGLVAAPFGGGELPASAVVAGGATARPRRRRRSLLLVSVLLLLTVSLVAGGLALQNRRHDTSTVAADPATATAPAVVLPFSPAPTTPAVPSGVPSGSVSPTLSASASPRPSRSVAAKPPSKPPAKPSASPSPISPPRGLLTIRSGLNGECLTDAGASVVMIACGGATIWQFLADGTIRRSGQCLNATPQVTVGACGAPTGQRWRFTNNALVNTDTRQCVDTGDVTRAGVAPVEVRTCAATLAQRWSLT